LSAAAVQRHHQQPGERFQRRVVGDEWFEVADDFPMPAERQCDLSAFRHRSQPELGEAGGFGGGPLLGREVTERVATPQRECVVISLHVNRSDAAVVGCVRDIRACGPDPVRELVRVHRRGVDGGAVSDPFASHDVTDPHGFEGAAQLGDPDLQRVHRVDRQRRLRPQPVHEHGGRDGAAGAEEQLGEQSTFSGAGQLHGCTVDADLHRPEQPVPHVVRRCSHPQALHHRPPTVGR
jgi:hypothetical protein